MPEKAYLPLLEPSCRVESRSTGGCFGGNLKVLAVLGQVFAVLIDGLISSLSRVWPRLCLPKSYLTFSIPFRVYKASTQTVLSRVWPRLYLPEFYLTFSSPFRVYKASTQTVPHVIHGDAMPLQPEHEHYGVTNPPWFGVSCFGVGTFWIAHFGGSPLRQPHFLTS